MGCMNELDTISLGSVCELLLIKNGESFMKIINSGNSIKCVIVQLLEDITVNALMAASFRHFSPPLLSNYSFYKIMGCV